MNRKTVLLVLLVCAVCANAFVYSFVSQERFIYSWDWANYWLKYQHVSDQIREAPFKALKSVAHSVRHDDYNLLSVLFLAPWNLLFGDSRVAFILAITNILALPSAAVLALSAARVCTERSDVDGTAAFSLSLFTIVLLPQMWIPVLCGEIGVIGLLIIGLIFLVYFKAPLDQQKLSDLVAVGMLLACLVLVRRWYAYWVVAFFIAAALDGSAFILSRHRFSLRQYLPVVRNLVIVGMTSLVTLSAVATPLVKRMLLTDYGDLYSAWKHGKSMAQLALESAGYFGVSVVVLTFLGFMFSLPRERARRLTSFLLVQCAVVFLLFAKTQQLGQQHYYLLIPGIAVLLSYFTTTAFRGARTAAARWGAMAAYALVLLIMCAAVFVPIASHYVGKLSLLLPHARHYPLVRNDVEEVRRILQLLSAKLVGDDTVYVLASSPTILNDEILRNACREMKEKESLCGKIVNVHHVDKRDGIPYQFLDARYVVTTTPLLYHLRQEDQRVIGIPADAIRSGASIGASYTRLPHEFSLDENTKVHIYERVLPIRRDDLESLFNEFARYYPDWVAKSEMSPLCGLITAKEAGDRVGQISCEGTSLFVHPGAHTPSRLALALAKEYTAIRMTLSFRDAEKVTRSCREIDGEISLTMTADGRTLFQDDITYRQSVPLEFNLRGVERLEIVVDKGRNGPDCDWFLLRDVTIE